MKKMWRWISLLLAFCLLAAAMPMWALAESSEAPDAASEVTGTPEPEVTGTPEPEVTGTPEPEVTGTPEPEVTGTPEPEVTGTPEPEVTGTPEPEVMGTPEPEVTGTPEPEVTGTPEPEVTGTPEPEVTGTPEPEVTGTPEPEVTGTPEPEATEIPEPEATETPKPEATKTPEPEIKETPKPEATLNPSATSRPDLELEEDEAIVICLPEEQNVPVRQEPDGQSAIIFTLPHQSIVTVLGVEGDWIQIEHQGQNGYVYKANIPSVPVIEPEEEKAYPKATIFSSREAVMEPGELVTLTSILEHADGYEIRYQWECDRGSGFEAVEGANDDYYVFEANQETLAYTWRLVVYYR